MMPNPRKIGLATTDWYKQHARKLPWRSDAPEPWLVLVSEFLLQQTQVGTIQQRFAEILAAIPDPKACAGLSDLQLQQLWQGLGYYRRAENLRRAARVLCEKYQQHIPSDPQALLALPGVGPYTAGAIAAIAFDLPVAGVDGNIARVYLRTQGITGTAETARPDATRWLEALYKNGSPRQLMQGLMDIGATICTPRKPKCDLCPLKPAGCIAANWKDPAITPTAPPRKTKPVHSIVAAWIRNKDICYLTLRPPGLLGNRPAPMTMAQKTPPKQIADVNGTAYLEQTLPVYRHTFTHLHWDVVPALYHWPETVPPSFAMHPETQIPMRRLAHIGLPRAFSKGLPQ